MLKILLKIYRQVILRVKSNIKYIIVWYDDAECIETFVCNGGRSNFKRNLSEIIKDNDFISGLIPEQACFMGLVWGKNIARVMGSGGCEDYEGLSSSDAVDKSSGEFEKIGFDRMGNLIFYNKLKNQAITEKAIIVAASSDFINKFDPVSAKEIGIFIGNRINKGIGITETETSRRSLHGEKIIDLKAYINNSSKSQ